MRTDTERTKEARPRQSCPSSGDSLTDKKVIFQATFMFLLCELKFCEKTLRYCIIEVENKAEIVGFEIGCGLNK